MDDSHHKDRELNERLDRLFAAYRAACGDPEPSTEFMPRLWQQIEGQRSFAVSLRRWAQALVTAAAAACLLLGLLATSGRQVSPVYRSTYVEALAEETADENLLSVGFLTVEPGGDTLR